MGRPHDTHLHLAIPAGVAALAGQNELIEFVELVESVELRG